MSLEEAVRRVGAGAGVLAANDWVRGRGWDQIVGGRIVYEKRAGD